MADIVDQIARLEELRARGVISDNEFQRLKSRLLEDGLQGVPTPSVERSPSPFERNRVNYGLMLAFAVVALLTVGFFGYPVVNEGASSECSSLEKLMLRKVAEADKDKSAYAQAGFGLVSLLQGMSDGKLAANKMKEVYPNLPPFFGCAVGYYRLALVEKELNETPNAPPSASQSETASDKPTAASAASSSLPVYNPAGAFAAAPPGIPRSNADQLVKFPGSGPNGTYVEGQTVAQIETVRGLLTSKWHVGTPELPDASAIQWGDRKLFADFAVNIDGAFPTNAKAEIVIASTDSGGNCCTPSAYLIDMTGQEPIVSDWLELQNEGIAISRRGSSLYVLSAKSNVEKDQLGDLVDITILYNPKLKVAIRSSYDGVTNFMSLVGQHPDTLLGDERARLPLVNILGTQFADFREHIQVSTKLDLKQLRYVVGQGCRPHRCDTSDGIYVIDVATGNAWARWFDDGRIYHAGEIPPGDIATYSGMADWLKTHGSDVQQLR